MAVEWFYLVLIIICLILSAVFSAAETALTSVSEAYVQNLIEKKHPLSMALRLWLHHPHRVLTSIIVGNNLVNTLSAVLATVLAQAFLAEHAIEFATVTITLWLLVVGEITPKTFARHNAKKVLGALLYVIYPVYIVLLPITWLLSHLASFLVRLFGGRTKKEGPLATEEDITYLIRLGYREGVLKKDQGRMLESVISFRETAVKEIMIPRTDMCSLEINTTVADALKQLGEHGYTRWPVYEGDIDHIKGVLYVKDLLTAMPDSELQKESLHHFIRKAFFVPESMKIDSVLREFQKKKVHLAVVVDEYGGTSGILTLEDVLEEIVGEIRDEYDREEDEEMLVKIGPDHYLVDGRMGLSNITKRLNLTFPEDESYESIGGFLVSQCGKIPPKGTSIQHAGWVFTVAEVEEKRIVRIDLKKLNHIEEKMQ